MYPSLRGPQMQFASSMRIITHPRPYSTPPPPHSTKSAHAQWYSDIVPGMIPIAILGSAVYLGLQLTQAKLSNEKYLEEAREKVKALEDEVEKMKEERHREGVRLKKQGRWWFSGA